MNADLISVLLVEDDPGDVLLVREAFEDHKVGNLLSVVSDGVEAMEYVRGEGSLRGRDAPGPDPAGPQPAAQERHRGARGDQGRPRAVDDPGRRAHDLRGRGGHRARLQAARQRLHHQARRLRALHADRAPDRRLLHRPREAAARALNTSKCERARLGARLSNAFKPPCRRPDPPAARCVPTDARPAVRPGPGRSAAPPSRRRCTRRSAAPRRRTTPARPATAPLVPGAKERACHRRQDLPDAGLVLAEAGSHDAWVEAVGVEFGRSLCQLTGEQDVAELRGPVDAHRRVGLL